MKYRLLILLVFVGGLAWGQNSWLETARVGIAVEDMENASLINMAALGVGNAAGIGVSGHWQGRQLEAGEAYIALSHFAYNFRAYNFRNSEHFIGDHEVGLGFQIYDGIYVGTSYRWNSEKNYGWNIQTLFRPSKWFSFAVKGNSLVSDSDSPASMELGVGLRPLSFNENWATRLTLFYDGAVTFDSGLYQNNAVGLRISPIDSLDIYGHWDFRSENYVVGMKLSFKYLLVGAEVPVAGSTPGESFTTEAFVTWKEMHSSP